MAINENPKRRRPKGTAAAVGAASTGDFFYYRVPKDVTLHGNRCYEDRIEELQEQGYVVEGQNSKGTTMKIPMKDYLAKKGERLNQFKAMSAIPKDLGEVVEQKSMAAMPGDFAAGGEEDESGGIDG